MIYLTCWCFLPLCWSMGGQGKIPPLYRYWRKALIPLALGIIAFPIIKLWAILLAGLSFASLTVPYGDEPDDLPRWLCGILYAIPLVVIAYFSHKWLIWGVQVVVSGLGSHFVNNWLNFKIKWHADRITEFLTCLCAYCLLPWII